MTFDIRAKRERKNTKAPKPAYAPPVGTKTKQGFGATFNNTMPATFEGTDPLLALQTKRIKSRD